MRRQMDVNSDMGESFGNWVMGNDAALFTFVTTANVACGFHAGDPVTLVRTVRLAKQNGVVVGAHPGLPDLLGFGRRAMKISAEDAYAYVVYQVGALQATLATEGMRLHHVKPHGAFYSVLKTDDELAEAVAEAIMQLSPEPMLYWPAPTDSALPRAVRKRGGRVVGEIYVDLEYAPDGSLVTASDDGRVAYWDPSTGKPGRAFEIRPPQPDPDLFTGAVAAAVPSPDGSTLAVVTYDFARSQELIALDARSGDTLWDGAVPDRMNSAVAWSPDGRLIATGGWQSGKLNLWDSATGRRTAEPVTANAGWVVSIDFAWNGSLVVTAGTDGTVRLFDTNTLEQVGANIPADDNVWASAAVTPGDEMLVLSQTAHAWRWNLDPVRWARQACLVANRTLTRSEWRAFLPGWDYAPSCGS